MESKDTRTPVTLVDPLSTTLILYEIVPYLSIVELLALGTTSKSLRYLLYETPHVFRYLDLSRLKSLSSYPLRNFFQELTKTNVLRHVQTLILDGLTVTSDLVGDIIESDAFSVRILSIREVKHLNEMKLRQRLLYAVRPTRPEGTPRLKGLYVFGTKDFEALEYGASGFRHCPPTASDDDDLRLSYRTRSNGLFNRETWYKPTSIFDLYLYGRRAASEERAWADTLRACHGLIAFDAILCQGPRHLGKDGSNSRDPRIADIALSPRACRVCYDIPERPALWGVSPAKRFPLMAPPPLHSSSVSVAKRPQLPLTGNPPALLARCYECLKERWCRSCGKFWCEKCYDFGRVKDKHGIKVAVAPFPSARSGIGLCMVYCLGGIRTGLFYKYWRPKR